MFTATVGMLGLLLSAQPGVGAPEPGVAAPPADVHPGESAPVRSMLLADDASEPVVTLRWQTRDGPVERSMALALGAPDQAAELGGTNLRLYTALGGTRLRMGLGHPDGVSLRVGLEKVRPGRALFPGIVPGSAVALSVRGVVFNQPVRAWSSGVLVHLGYALEDLETCSLPESAASQYLLADPDDHMAGIVEPGRNGTPGALAGRAWAEPAGERGVTLRVELPYGMLRHLLDPWDSELPGTFFEPVRLHAEVEVLPAWAEPIGPSRSPD